MNAASDAVASEPAELPASNGDHEPEQIEPAPRAVSETPVSDGADTTDVPPIAAAFDSIERRVGWVAWSPPTFEPESVPEPHPTPVELSGETGFVAAPTGEPLPHLPAAVCAPVATADALTAFFDGGQPMIGADYQRAFPLRSGRVLWLFQDAFLPTSHGPELVHNVGLLQSGQCFQLLRTGSADAPTSYLFPELTDPMGRWFWPLGGDLGADGQLHVFVVEMIERSRGYLRHTDPVATWLVTIDVDDLSVVDQRLAPDPSEELYGWSVVSAGDHTYLYSHCYRQFGFDPLWFAPDVLAHDLDCTADVRVARIPRGEFEAALEYWNGDEWVADPADAVAVIPTEGRGVNPTQVALLEGRFVAVTKIDDWWGRVIVLDVADAAEGPWRTYDEIPVETECDDCNTYFASIVPYGAADESFVVGLSCNTFGDQHDHQHYTPTFLRVPAPHDDPNRTPRSA